MLNKKIMLLAILLVGLLAVSAVSAEDNATSDVVSVEETYDDVSINQLTVKEIDDSSSIDEIVSSNDDQKSLNAENEVGTFKELSRLIQDIDDNGTLNLTKDYICTSESDFLNLSKPLCLNGNGHSIDGNNIYKKGITVHNSTLKNINFINGKGYDFTYSTVINCIFKNSDNGGFAVRGNSKIINSTIENFHRLSNSLIFTSTAPFYYESSYKENASFINCTFSHNTLEASKIDQADLFYSGEHINLLLYNCTFNKNSVSIKDNWYYKSSLIFVEGETTIIDNCKFIENSISGNGKGIILFELRGNAMENIFEVYPNITIKNCLFESNLKDFNGGAINIKGTGFDDDGYGDYEYVSAIVNINNCSFKGNQAQNGSALYVSTNYYADLEMNIENCLFENNPSEYGAVYLDSELGSIYFNGCQFKDNCANYGSAIYANQSPSLQIMGSTFNHNNASKNGGAIYLDVNGWVISGSQFFDNNATKDAGIYCTGEGGQIKDSYLINTVSNPVVFSEKFLVSANYNWWGNTLDNYKQRPLVNNNKLEVSNWLFLNISVDNTMLKVGDIAIISCDLAYLTGPNGAISKYYSFNLPNIQFDVESDNEDIYSVNLVGGSGEIKYVATSIPSGFITIKYNNIEKTINFIIEKGDLKLNISDFVILNGNLLVSAQNKANGTVHVLINNKNYSSNMVDGKSFVPVNDLSLGTYLATTSFESVNYNTNISNSYITVKSSINANDLIKTQGDNSKFKATFYDFDGNVIINTKVTFMVNGKLQTATTNNKGIASLDINLSPNSYDILSLNPITDETVTNKIIITADSSSTIKPINEKDINIPSLTEGLGTVKLPSDAKGAITFDIAGKKYDFPVVNGVAKVNMADLTTGVYGYIITYSGDSKYASFTKTGSLTVHKIISTSVSCSAVTTVYNGGKYLVVTLKDISGNLLSGMKLTLVLNGNTYTPTTDANGQAKVSTNGLTPKTYTATITFAGNTNYAKSSATANVVVKKATPKITAAQKNFEPTVKTKKYSITLKNNQNKAMKNTKVSIKVNGNTYTATTKSNGVATFNLKKLTKKGTFKAVITYKGNANYDKVTKKVTITVKPTPKITAKAATFKKSVKTKKYTITLKDNKNKVMKKTKVSLKVNGKTFKATTNTKGVATFKITKLTKKGTYKSVVSFAGNKNFNKATKKVNIKVK